MADLFSDPDLWQNQSIMFNMTAVNNSSAYKFSPARDKAITILTIIVMFIVMVSLGCTMEVSKIKHHIVRPKGVAIAVLAQYGVMPLTAFCLAKLYIYCHGFNLQNSVPYVDIIVSLVLILIPCGGGILINYYRPQYSKTITRVGLIVMIIAAVVAGALSIYAVGGSILTVLSPLLMAIAALMPFIGYTFGYIISWLFRLNQSERRTVSMETGCQNAQLCSTILKLTFPPAVMGPLFLFPVVYIFFQVMEAALLIVLFRYHQRFTLKEKEGSEPAVDAELAHLQH